MSINDRVAGGARRNALCWLREDMSKKFSQQGFRFSKKKITAWQKYSVGTVIP
ncbi:MAG: hypothetical protein H0U64_01620 [Gemmatimonadaceae bacterium]|nr:hypothetical protein [Gemmatimonadaceae bacterium]